MGNIVIAHYLLTALRHFRRHKLTTAISVIGLPIIAGRDFDRRQADDYSWARDAADLTRPRRIILDRSSTARLGWTAPQDAVGERISRPVVIANVVAWPIAFVAANSYISSFAHRAEPGAVPYVTGLTIMIGVVALSASGQAFIAARVKPATTLRRE